MTSRSCCLPAVTVSTWQAMRASRNAREQVRQRHLAETARRQVTEALNQMAFQRAEALLTAGEFAEPLSPGWHACSGITPPTTRRRNGSCRRSLTGASLCRLQTGIRHEGMAGAQFSPAGQYFAASCSDKSAGVWDAETGQLVHRFDEDATVFSTEFTPDGRGLLAVLEEH